MKITALIENTAGNSACAVEHGLSLYVETDRHKILFDAGQSGLFAHNAEKLGIDLAQVDVAVLSHGHFDHAGGMTVFLRKNKHARIYANRGFSKPHYNPEQRYIGVEPPLIGSQRVVCTDDYLQLDDQLTLFTCNQQDLIQPIQSYGMTEETNETLRPDQFLHEQYLRIQEGDTTVLLSGCTHKGICNLMHWIQPMGIQVLIGGFHFMKIEPENYEILDQAAQELMQYPVTYYTCHCTGQMQYHYLKGKMGDQLHYLAAGESIQL